jgi:glycosyltransferase involved in cell wall biosynthesis
MPECVVVVPCYNEAGRLQTGAFREFVQDSSSILFVFVNDGSTDGTRDLLDALSAGDGDHFMVLHLDRNRGKAEAVRRGMLRAIELKATYAGYWDADLATPLSTIRDFVDHLDRHPALEIVLGARVRLLGRHIVRRPVRHYTGRVFATCVSLSLGIAVYDTQCGAKMFRVSPAMNRIFDQEFLSKWIFDVEILARFLHDRRGRDMPSVDDLIHEFPLDRWEDVAGSKLKPRDFVKAIYELGLIHFSWLRKGARSRRRAVEHSVE